MLNWWKPIHPDKREKMEQPIVLQQKKHVFIWRWLVILAGIAMQGTILLLLLVSKKQIFLINATLMPMAGKPTECRVVWVNPFPDATNQDIWAGITVPASSSGAGTGKTQSCQPARGIHIQTVRSKQLIVVLIYNDSDTVFTIVISNSTDIIAPTLVDAAIESLLTILFNIVGSAIFLRARDRSTARIAYMLFLILSLMCLLINGYRFHILWISILLLNLQMLTNGLSTTFISLFPHARKNQIRRKRIMPYSPLLVGIVLVLVNTLLFFLPLDLRHLLFIANIGYNTACLLVVIWGLFVGISKIDRKERYTARILMIGVAFFLLVMIGRLGTTSSDPFRQNSFIPPYLLTQQNVVHLIPLTLTLFPVICSYVLFRDQFLGTTSLLSRWVTRGLLWILLASLFMLPSILFLQTVDRNMQPDIRDYAYAGLLILSLWLFPLVWNKVRDVGDRLFYGDFYQYNRSLREISTALTRLQGLDRSSAFLLPQLSQLLNASDVVLLIRALSQDELLYNTNASNSTTCSWHHYSSSGQDSMLNQQIHAAADYALHHCVQRSHEPVLLHTILLLALYDGDQVSGFLCLGPKKNLEPYSRQDKSFLATLAAQLSLLEVNNRYLAQAQSDAHKLTALNHRVISTQEDERRHLALDLHDDVLQEAMLLVRQLSDASTMSDVADAMPLARSVVTNLRRTCLALRPSLLDELGLVEALRWLARQTEQLGGGRIHLEVRSMNEASDRFSTMVELALYRVAQEALTNIVKHAQASHVIIRLRYSPSGQIALLIIDDGQGFRMGQIAGESLGIVGMHERMGAIGGHIRVRTTPLRGTVVRAVCTDQDTTHAGAMHSLQNGTLWNDVSTHVQEEQPV